MIAGYRITILTTRDLVRLGLQAALTDLSAPVHFTGCLNANMPTDLILLDATGTTDEAIGDLETLSQGRDAPVIVLTSRAAPLGFDHWTEAVHGFLTVSATREEITTAVTLALQASAVARAARALDDPETSSGLTPREIQVLTGIAAGKSNAKIAAELYLGGNTVKSYIRSAYRKAGARSRSQAVLWALDHGLGANGVGLVLEDADNRWRAGTNPS